MIDITGQKFGRLTALSFSHMSNNSIAHWLFECECGNKKTLERSSATRGMSKSCGCLRKELSSKRSIKHGNAASTTHRETPTYRTWGSMIQRCRHNNSFSYAHVNVCDDWLKFENFLRDMGDRPNGLTLDRIDNEKGYSKDNCRWADKRTQTINTRKTSKKTSSKYKGVNRPKGRRLWNVTIKPSVNEKPVNKFGFKTEEEAAICYNELAIKYHGDLAILNVVQ